MATPRVLTRRKPTRRGWQEETLRVSEEFIIPQAQGLQLPLGGVLFCGPHSRVSLHLGE